MNLFPSEVYNMYRVFIVLFFACVAVPIAAQDKPADKSIAQRPGGVQRLDGCVALYGEAASGKMLMEISRFNQEFLYQVSLPAGLGFNAVGLDRGQLGRTRIVIFERIGPKVLLVEPN